MESKNNHQYQSDESSVISLFQYPEEEYHRNGRDSRLVLILALCCLVFPMFIPVSIGLIFIIRNTIKKEGKNKRNLIAMILCIIALVITVAFFVAVNILTPSSLSIII